MIIGAWHALICDHVCVFMRGCVFVSVEPVFGDSVRTGLLNPVKLGKITKGSFILSGISLFSWLFLFKFVLSFSVFSKTAYIYLTLGF